MSDMTKRMQSFFGETTEAITTAPDRLMKASRGALNMTREEADQLVQRGEDLFEELVKRGEEIEEQQMERFGEWLKSWQERGRKQMHMAEEQFEQRVQHVLRAMRIPSADDVATLQQELDKISKKVEAYVRAAEEAKLPVANYGDLNAKQVIAMLDSLDEPSLLAIQRFEMAHDNRKTVLREIEHRLQAEKM